MSVAAVNERISGWRHVRAVALLPFTNAVVIPGALLTLFPPAMPFPRSAFVVASVVTGAALVAAGAALVTHSIRLFMRFGHGTLAPWDPARALLSAGAYGHVRNPLKAGLFLMLAGEALLTRSVALGVWFGCFALVNVVYIRLHEEPGLEQRFGDRYRDYCALVPRWWPRLRPLRNRAMGGTTS